MTNNAFKQWQRESAKKAGSTLQEIKAHNERVARAIREREAATTFKYIILVNSHTRYRTNVYQDALDQYYLLCEHDVATFEKDWLVEVPPIVVQLIDVEIGTVAEYRP